jgi:uncharacterized protein (TIGR02757 family)
MIPIKIRKAIEEIYRRYHKPEFLQCDPLCWVRRFPKSDVISLEIAGLIASCFAYGQVGLIQKCLNTIIDKTGLHLRDFSLHTSFRQKAAIFKDIRYRMNTGTDLALLLESTAELIRKHGSISEFLAKIKIAGDMTIKEPMIQLVIHLRHHAYQLDDAHIPSFNHLLPDPRLGGACKRLCMYFRWMVRPDDGIDLGLWKHIRPSALIIPVDTHIARMAQHYELTKRTTADWKMAMEITNNLRSLSPDDTVKYDFSLCQAGMKGTVC